MGTTRRRRPLHQLAVLAALGLVATACGGAAASAAGPTAPPPTPPGPTGPPPDAADVVVADRRLAAELYRELTAEEDGNLFFSPYSITLALSMLEPGARGATAEQLRALLGMRGGEASGWHDARRSLTEQMAAPASSPEGFDPLRLAVANGAFAQEGFGFEAAYLDRLAESYGAAFDEVDFRGDPDGARGAVNGWVAERTEGHITDLLPEGSVSDLTRLVLANAVFFAGNWLHPFATSVVEPFTTLEGDVVEADTMHAQVRTTYVGGEGWAAVRLPYAGGSSMLVVVPDPGRFTEVEAALDGVLEALRGVRSDFDVDLALPKFAFATTADLEPALERLGVVDAFDERDADLSGISTEARLYVDGAYHQATVEVDESGTTATAATGIVVGVASAPPPAELRADRPFLVAVEHDATGELLFLGRVLDPTG